MLGTGRTIPPHSWFLGSPCFTTWLIRVGLSHKLGLHLEKDVRLVLTHSHAFAQEGFASRNRCRWISVWMGRARVRVTY